MDSNQYKSELHKLETGPLLDLVDWAAQQAGPWVRKELLGILQTPIIKMSHQEAIRSGFATTLTEMFKLPEQARYYVAHLTMFESELEQFIAAGRGLSASPSPYAASTELEIREGLTSHLFGAIVLLERCGGVRLDLPGAYGAYSVSRDHTFPVFKAAEQAVYGRYSGLTHLDRAPHAPIAILRTALELRIRRAFEIQSFFDTKNFAARPIQLSDIFEVIFEHERKISAAVDLHDVQRIYKWSNPYLHAGRRDFVWSTGFAVQYLRPLFTGKRKLQSRGGWSVHGGLEMPLDTWNRIRGHFSKIANAKKLLLLPEVPAPECILF